MTYYSGCDYSVKMRGFNNTPVNSAKSHHKCGSCVLLGDCLVKKERKHWVYDGERHAYEWWYTLQVAEHVSQAAALARSSAGRGEIHIHG